MAHRPKQILWHAIILTLCVGRRQDFGTLVPERPNAVSSPEADTSYMGSSSDAQFKQDRKHKLILTKHSTRADAVQAECFFHEFYNVGANSEFANRARQTSIGFDRQGVQHSESSKRKMSAAKRGDRHHLFGKNHSEETKKKISAAKRGQTFSEETKQKMSAAKRGDRHPFFGKNHTEESKKKMSETRQGKTLSEETKKKMSEARRGKLHSEETKQKMSAAHPWGPTSFLWKEPHRRVKEKDERDPARKDPQRGDEEKDKRGPARKAPQRGGEAEDECC
ncbi:unnamed protein product [Prorocentrum cordatum]|uniref:Nuclease associated modular domain-containing protein n=1 Tax=Prorocentrum cordatum TaxID=2364126 RepID=A0ABN9W5D5_9DINO|nr:unnamed protein product [Polarella glacialis]